MINSSAIEKKIGTFYTVQDIVDAMKAYASVNVRRTEELVRNIRSYEANLVEMMRELHTFYPDVSFEKTGGKRILLAVGSSQGLCGLYNDKASDLVAETLKPDDTLLVLGRRFRSVLDSRRIAYRSFYDSAVSPNGIRGVLSQILSEILALYQKEEYYSVTLLFSVIAENEARTSVEQILPPPVSGDPAPLREPPLTYIAPELMRPEMIEEYLYVSLYRCLIESIRSENWYRLRSMQGASENIKRRLSEFDTLRKYIRQEEITEEMLEILGSGMFYK